MGDGNMEVLRERRRIREKILGEARIWAENLNLRSTVILIGSYARGDFNKWSDVDVLIIADFKGNPLERLKMLDAPPGYQLIPLTPEEFKRLYRKSNPIALEAMEKGVVLREDIKMDRLIEDS